MTCEKMVIKSLQLSINYWYESCYQFCFFLLLESTLTLSDLNYFFSCKEGIKIFQVK